MINTLVDLAISRARLTMVVLAFLFVAGFSAYLSIPKEAEPDVKIPLIYVSLTQRGISPEDAERLLLRPVETQLKAITNVKEMRGASFEGGGYVLLEFDAGFDSTKALADVRAKVDDAKRDLPRDADEPKVQEVNLSLFPILVVSLGGDLPERTLVRLARTVKTAIEQTPGVLSAELRGARDEAVEIIVEPMLLKSYGVSLDDLIRSIGAGNSLVAAGALEGGTGRFAIKVPALIEHPEDVLKLPVAASSGASVTLGDVAEVRPTFKDAVSITRINGKPAIAVEVVKRTGANIIETVDAVKATVERLAPGLPATLQITFQQDRSTHIRTMLNDLQNSVVTGLLLVAMIMLYTLGWRASLFIGLAVPGSFLAGILALSLSGLTVNIVVLFTLILAIGELVDNAIIVTEYAERRMAEGMRPREAYALAAKRMAAPCFAATATRLVTFSPLLFWPGIVGQFMKYLPITFMATLIASLVFALVFTPTLGALIAKPNPSADADGERVGERSPYLRVVRAAIASPGVTLVITLATLVSVFAAYARFGNGVEFFPSVEPDYGLVHVRARGNLSLDEKDRLVREVERVLFEMPEIAKIYARVGERQRGSDEVPEDTIGSVQYEFIDWQQRRRAGVIMDEIRARTAHLPGVIIEVAAPRAGPPTGKPVTLRLAAPEPTMLQPAAKQVADLLRAIPELRDVDDGQPLPGIDWRLEVDKSEAAKYGASALTVGNAVQLVTNGLKVTEFRPNETDKQVDILLRFPPERRSLNELDDLRINTPAGAVPIGNFVERVPEQRVSILHRAQGARVMTVTANVAEGVQTAAVQKKVVNALSQLKLPAGVTFQLKGEDEEREKAQGFLSKAFGTAVFLIFATLLAQFNRFSSVLMIMSAVVFSTVGVLIGLLITGHAFGVVMTGLGIISIAGIIVNNNIVLIDTYDQLRREGWGARDAILESCAQRARPVFLTAITSVLGVMPIAFGINIEFLEREVTVGAPSTQWWVQLSTATVFGIGFATVLTLIITPAMLMGAANIAAWRRRRRVRRVQVPAGAQVVPAE
ncbi:MAG TPA: efflux RND transporter permease subunit [Beijerinckiaceae bacterium]|nr:efflux RND transporter permease subunit [Beijerinckiaceae bacterium]